jgi:5'-deoxynucleotidase YfbR-like HD superfamily hydrolase
VGLLGELSDLKRVRVAGRSGSLAEQAFRRAWGALVAGEPLADVAARETGRALAATRLAGIDAGVLRGCGVDPAPVLRRAVEDPALAAAALTDPPAARGPRPAFVDELCAQPRAGATAPGRPRLVLEPPESHGDHCLVVAVFAVLLAPDHGADPAPAFLAGLAHHLHNATLPDAGFAGEELLRDELEVVVGACRERALAQLTEPLRSAARDAAALALRLDTPEARAVVAADVLDRVVQMRHFERAARFTLDQALDDLELVHPGPLQAFGEQVLAEAGLR